MRAILFRGLAAILTLVCAVALLTGIGANAPLAKLINCAILAIVFGVFALLGDAPTNRLLTYFFGFKHAPESDVAMTDNTREGDETSGEIN